MTKTDTSLKYVWIFGYGSLVNRKTLHDHKDDFHIFRLSGWQRCWSHCVTTTKFGNICALTVRAVPGQEVMGALIQWDRNNLSQLDAREQEYRRVKIAIPESLRGELGFTDLNAEAYTYATDPPVLRSGDQQYPIWRSYLECVLAGFLDVGGRAAVTDFINTTAGWDTPILDDRKAPKYERFSTLPSKIQQAIDELIQQHDLERTQFTSSR